MIYFNNQLINNLFFNNQEMNKLYFNNTLVWQKIVELNSYLMAFGLLGDFTDLSFTNVGSGSLISYNGEYVWLNTTTYNAKFISNATRMFLNSNCSNMFRNCRNLTSDMLNNIPFDYSLVENSFNMFDNCRGLTSLQNVSFDNLTTGAYMFATCSNLTSLQNVSFDNLTNGLKMFGDCSKLTSLQNVSFDNLTTGAYMFQYCGSLVNLPESATFNNLINGFRMFAGDGNLKFLPKNLTFDKLTDVNSMFSSCRGLVNLPENCIFNSLLNGAYMFNNCYNLTGNFYIGYNSSGSVDCERMFVNLNNNLPFNIHVCKNSVWDKAIHSRTTQTNSITGTSIYWTNMENGFYNSQYNIFVYNNYIPQQ